MKKFASLRLRCAVRTTRRVDAIFGQHQALHGFSVHNVGLDNFFHIIELHMPIPDRIGIDHNRRPVFALIETSGHVGANTLFESPQCEFLLEEKLQLGLARRIATSARMSCLALITANENMLLELGHETNLQDSRWYCWPERRQARVQKDSFVAHKIRVRVKHSAPLLLRDFRNIFGVESPQKRGLPKMR